MIILQANEAGDKSSAELKKELEKTKNELDVAKSGIRWFFLDFLFVQMDKVQTKR